MVKSQFLVHTRTSKRRFRCCRVELPLDTLEGYSLDFSVFERSPTADVLYGTAHVHDVKAAILNKTKELDLDITLSNDFKSTESNMTKGNVVYPLFPSLLLVYPLFPSLL